MGRATTYRAPSRRPQPHADAPPSPPLPPPPPPPYCVRGVAPGSTSGRARQPRAISPSVRSSTRATPLRSATTRIWSAKCFRQRRRCARICERGQAQHEPTREPTLETVRAPHPRAPVAFYARNSTVIATDHALRCCPFAGVEAETLRLLQGPPRGRYLSL